MGLWDGAEEVESPEMRLWDGAQEVKSSEMRLWDGAEEVKLSRCGFEMELRRWSLPR